MSPAVLVRVAERSRQARTSSSSKTRRSRKTSHVQRPSGCSSSAAFQPAYEQPTGPANPGTTCVLTHRHASTARRTRANNGSVHA